MNVDLFTQILSSNEILSGNDEMKKMIIVLIKFALCLSVFTSCGSNDDRLKDEQVVIENQEESKPLDIQFYSSAPQSHIWKESYSKLILETLNRSELNSLLYLPLNSSDLAMLKCNGYERATMDERKKFIVLYLASIAYAESGLNPKTTYLETDGSLSSGLLQIDTNSANRHAGAYVDFLYTQEDVLNPHLNLLAGLYILKHQLEGGMNDERPDIKNRLFTNKSYYWSVITLKKEHIIKTFVANSERNLDFCLR